jgi:biotin carboxyl carrier protein
MIDAPLPVLVAKDDRGDAVLLAPKVGLWSDAPRDDAWIEPGSSAGTLVQLRRRFDLVIPDGVACRVAIETPNRHAVPVAYGETLFRVVGSTSVKGSSSTRRAAVSRAAKRGLTVGSPTDGVFYSSPASGERPYVVVGDRVTVGQPIGLVEVMKTFNPIAYGGAGLPDDAEIVEVLVADGVEVRAGQPLVLVKTL